MENSTILFRCRGKIRISRVALMDPLILIELYKIFYPVSIDNDNNQFSPDYYTMVGFSNSFNEIPEAELFMPLPEYVVEFTKDGNDVKCSLSIKEK